MLAEADAELPPILLHRQTMRVVDGMHRLEAARIRGARTIKARFFDGDEEEAFVLAVESNAAHGLPLSLSDRKAAALRIVRTHPHWSDRAVAAKAGLAHKTVGAIRRSSGEVPHLEARVGRDGRVRSVVRTSKGKRELGEPSVRGPKARPQEEARDESPGAEIRDFPPIASRRSALPVASGNPGIPEQDAGPASIRASADTDWKASLQRLRTDPSLRYTEAGRLVLRVLDAHMAATDQLRQIAEMLPEHCLDALAGFALKCADDCHRFAVRLEQRRSECQ
ncbi:ParB/RepB/Spo0J family partition protein [Kitasatospora sp. MAP5-34]|uniref:ParB/RepB/Spo0J family partition protein n=1 Tax=Kitasatospora sp. MAP5-34 TaxID=3035102 RepID=UPI0024734ECA|nr:ParB/RepB/Spo0J family partition protein [Kitasatospora sp. MAP5-34]